MVIKGALDNYDNRAIEISSCMLLFSDFRYALQATQRGNSQLTHDIVALINRVVVVQMTQKILHEKTAVCHNAVDKGLKTKLSGATAYGDPLPTVLTSVFMTLCTKMHEHIFRSSDQSDAKSPMFSSQASLALTYRLTEGMKV
ncbi:hypothetical protein TNCV_1974701 [Trichonephila clavipes]|nr:hypothetical protein TNCV_1974701 [Trichonephila clavipes]